MKEMNRKDLMADEEPQNGVSSSLTKVAVKENDASSSIQIPPLVIPNNFPNLTITPVASRSETLVKPPTEVSIKITPVMNRNESLVKPLIESSIKITPVVNRNETLAKPPTDGSIKITPVMNWSETLVKPPIEGSMKITPIMNRNETFVKPPTDSSIKITPVMNRSETVVKPPTEGSMKITPIVNRNDTLVKPATEGSIQITPVVNRSETLVKPPTESSIKITPVMNRSEPVVKSPTEGSLKISIRYADITPPLKDKHFKAKPAQLPPQVPAPPALPSSDAQPSDSLLSLPKGLTILPVISSSELTSSSHSSVSKENVELASVSILSSITLQEIQNTNKTTKDESQLVAPNLSVEKVPDNDCENRPIIEGHDQVDRLTVIENDQSSNSVKNTAKESLPKDLTSQIGSSIAISSTKETAQIPITYSTETAPISISFSKETAPISISSSKEAALISISSSKETAPISISSSKETAPVPISFSNETTPISISSSKETAPISVSSRMDTAPIAVSSSKETVPLLVDLSDDSPTKCVLVKGEEIQSSTSDNANVHTTIPDPPVTQERKSEVPSQVISVPTNSVPKNNESSSDAKPTDTPLPSSAAVNLTKKAEPQASIVKGKARLKISPRLSDTQRNQRLAQFCYNVEPRPIHKMPTVNENGEAAVRTDHGSSPKVVDKENSLGNKERRMSVKHVRKCVVKLTRLPMRVESLFLKRVKRPDNEETYNIESEGQPDEGRGSFAYRHSPKRSEGRNKGRAISKKRKLSAEKEVVPTPGGKILRIRNGNEVMCTKIMSKTVEPSEKTRCTFCGKLTQSTNVWKHLLAVYKVKADIDEALEDDPSMFKCTECGAVLCSKAALGIHCHHLHIKPNKYECKCPCCSESFLTDVSLACHMDKDHQDILKVCTMGLLPNEEPPKIFNCCLCRRSFISFQSLESHLRVHGGKIKNNQCKVCLKTFSKSYQLKCHMVVHTELRPFKCEQCGKTFRFKSSLRTHNYFHIGVHPYKCKVCDKGFFEKSKLAKHMHNVHKEGTGLIPEYQVPGKSEKVVSRIKLVKVKCPKKLTLSKVSCSPSTSTESGSLLENGKETDVVKNTFKIITVKKKGHGNKEHKEKKHKVAIQKTISNETTKVPEIVDNDVQIVAAISREQPKNVSELPQYISSNVKHTESRPSVVKAIPVPGARSAVPERGGGGGTAPSVSQRMVIPPNNNQSSSALAQLEQMSRTMLHVSETKHNAPELYKNLTSSHSYHPQNHLPLNDDSSMLFHLLTAKQSSVLPETNGVVTVSNSNEEFKVSSLCNWTGNELPFENMAGNVVMDVTLNCVLCDALYVTSHEMADHLTYYHRVTTKNVNNIMMSYCK